VFERFSDRARRAVVLAQEEARDLGHGHVGTEHLLLGLVADEETTAYRVLAAMGVSAESLRNTVREHVSDGDAAVEGNVPFTGRAKKALELSLREALQLRHDYIGTGHILLGLIREAQGTAAQVLTELGVELDAARRHVRRGDEAPAAEREGPPRTFTAGHLGEVADRLGAIEARLGAIEDRLGAIEHRLDGSAAD
jgi:ATP-dependent Clp protease ATP-binding subunit ClpA